MHQTLEAICRKGSFDAWLPWAEDEDHHLLSVASIVLRVRKYMQMAPSVQRS